MPMHDYFIVGNETGFSEGKMHIYVEKNWCFYSYNKPAEHQKLFLFLTIACRFSQEDPCFGFDFSIKGLK